MINCNLKFHFELCCFLPQIKSNFEKLAFAFRVHTVPKLFFDFIHLPIHILFITNDPISHFYRY
jgi:hypothetical protein